MHFLRNIKTAFNKMNNNKDIVLNCSKPEVFPHFDFFYEKGRKKLHITWKKLRKIPFSE